MNKYKVETLTFDDLNNNIVLPDFQRRLVWSEPQKKSFIETLKNGYPFGSILIYKYRNDGLLDEKYSLIDGLQRITTIDEYKKTPHKYINFESITEELYNFFKFNTLDLSERHKSMNKKKIEEIIKKCSIELLEKKGSYNSSLLYDLFYEQKELMGTSPKYKEAEDEGIDGYHSFSREINGYQEDISNLLSNSINLEQLKIPTIVFTGDETELADVFQNLNLGGKKLSKYQVFAAQWNRYKVDLDKDDKLSMKVMDIIIDRYNELDETRNIQIKDYDPIALKESSSITFAEFCYALGVVAVNSMSVFFPQYDELLAYEDMANEIGYSTLAIILSISNRKLHELIEDHHLFENKDFVAEVLEKVKRIYKEINAVFENKFKIPGLTTNRYATKGYTNFMLLSYFASLWHTKHQLDGFVISNKPKYRRNYDKIQKNIIQYFIMDQASSHWSGTGDSKIDEIVVNDHIRYLKPINIRSFEHVLMSWHEERCSKSNILFDNLSRTIITYIANENSNLYKENNYEFEHVIPRSKIQKIYKNANIAGGSLGNIMILERRNNNIKKDKSLYEASFENQGYSDEFLKASNYPDRYKIDEVFHELESECICQLNNGPRINRKVVHFNL